MLSFIMGTYLALAYTEAKAQKRGDGKKST